MRVAENALHATQSGGKIAGLFLLGSLLAGLLALAILIASGSLPAFSASLRGSLAETAPYTGIFRWLLRLWVIGWMLQMLGFGLLARLLVCGGEEQLAILAFLGVLLATLGGVLHGTFHMSVEVWAAQEAARTGSVPEVYEPLRAWASSTFGVGYVVHLLATAGFGWGILRAGLVSPGIGWAAIGWSVLWLVGYAAGAGAPGVLFIMPAVFGGALLLR